MADFQAHIDAIGNAGAFVVAASVDPLDKAQLMIDKERLTFPVAYGLDALEYASSIGCFYQPEGPYLQPTGIIVAPDGTVLDSCYANGAVGRITAEDAVSIIAHRKKQLAHRP